MLLTGDDGGMFTLDNGPVVAEVPRMHSIRQDVADCLAGDDACRAMRVAPSAPRRAAPRTARSMSGQYPCPLPTQPRTVIAS